jgi:hypothetical protein
MVLSNNKAQHVGTGILMFFAHSGAFIGYLVSGYLIHISFDLYFIFGGSVLFLSCILCLLYPKLRR